MITLIVHELNKKPKSKSFEQNIVVIGREEAADLILTDVSVSRQHAKVFFAQDGQHYVQMISDKNPILVNGDVIAEHTVLQEGDELQFGPYLIYFSKMNDVQKKYMQEKTHRYEAQCRSCDWLGVLSVHAANPACPRCGGKNFVRTDDLAHSPMASERTTTLNLSDLTKLNAATRTAKNARVERMQQEAGKQTKIHLTEEKSILIGGVDSDFPIGGLRLGGTATIFWDGNNFVVTSEGFRPKLKINGRERTKANLKNGDVLNMGKSDFRFVVE
jgi:predicted component of type VI protein secretion system